MSSSGLEKKAENLYLGLLFIINQEFRHLFHEIEVIELLWKNLSKSEVNNLLERL